MKQVGRTFKQKIHWIIEYVRLFSHKEEYWTKKKNISSTRNTIITQCQLEGKKNLLLKLFSAEII